MLGPFNQFGPTQDMLNVLRNPPQASLGQTDPTTGAWQPGYQQNFDANQAAMNNWQSQIGMQRQLDQMNRQGPPPPINPSMATPTAPAPAATPVATPDQSPSLNQTITQAYDGQAQSPAPVSQQPTLAKPPQQQSSLATWAQQYNHQPEQTQAVVDTLRSGEWFK